MKKQIDAKKTVYYIIALNLLQAVGVLAALVYTVWGQNHTGISFETTTLLLLFLFVLFSAVITAACVVPILRTIDEYHSIGTILSETEKLNRTLRAQRHDFLNQLQVVYGLIELGEYDSANTYIEKVYEDIQKVSNVLRTDHAALNAILQAKAGMCKARGIEIIIEVNSRFTDISMPIWQLCRIFGNIIDNAVTALSEDDTQHKSITVTLSETVKDYTFQIANNGPANPTSQWVRIFEPGFTTKKEDGHGMGLSICRELMTAYGGKLTLNSTTTETVFEGTLPKRADIPCDN